MRLFYPLLALVALVAAPAASAQITVAQSGNWSDPATWSGGVVPTANDDVLLDSTVTVDIANAEVRNVTIRGEGDAGGELRTAPGGLEGTTVGITIFGDLTLTDDDAEVKPLSNKGPNPGNSDPNCSDTDDFGFGAVFHRLTIHGSIDNSNGGTFDMRRGSTSGSDTCNGEPSASFIDLIFAGGEDAMLTLGDYDNSDNQLFRTEIAKSDGASVTLGNDATIDNNSLAVLTLTSGYLVTGEFRFSQITSSSSALVGGSPASYIIGEFSRGLPKSGDGQNVRPYPIGDEDAYRPVNIYITDKPSDDQFLAVRAVSGDADPGSAVLNDGLMDLSPVRYYAVTTYLRDTAEPLSIDRIELSYGNDDEVPEGSEDFVVAVADDDRTEWTSAGGFDADGTTPHVTTLASPPTSIQSGDLTGFDFEFDVNTLDANVNYAAIGTTAMFGTASEGRPVAGALGLTAAPNPSTGDTALSFTLEEAADVTLEVFDVLGRRVTALASGPLPAGDQSVRWDAGALAPGLYVVRLQAGAVAASQTITIAR